MARAAYLEDEDYLRVKMSDTYKVLTGRGSEVDPIDSASPHFHHTVWPECGRSVARMWPNSGHVVVTPPHLHHKPTRKVAGFVVKL